jgi:periplasmic protein TonB
MSTAPKPFMEPPQPPLPPDFLPSLFGLGAGEYQVKPTNFIVSFVLHSIVVGLLLTSGYWVVKHQDEIKQTVTGVFAPSDISPYVMTPSKTQAGGGGGGGDRDKLQASKGGVPKQSLEQITPPMVIKRNEDPKLPVAETVVVPPSIPLPKMENIGDPISKILGPSSNGTGFGGGVGNGSGGGIGSGRGPGVGPGWGGGTGGGAYRVGGGVSAPKALFAPDPEYSEEARKAKYQGTVILWVLVGPDGRAHDIRVQRPLGMGLDEKAMEAVKNWKFEPAKLNGSPVAVQVNIEVNFHLY